MNSDGANDGSDRKPKRRDVRRALKAARRLNKHGVISEFKTFALKGNVVDLAVGIVIGAAFTAIVNSFVKDLIMPIVGFLTAGTDFSKLFVTIGDVKFHYGLFIQAVVNFFIIALSVFFMVKLISMAKRGKEAAEDEAPQDDSAEVALLTEIRDILRDQDKAS